MNSYEPPDMTNEDGGIEPMGLVVPFAVMPAVVVATVLVIGSMGVYAAAVAVENGAVIQTYVAATENLVD